MHNGWEPEMAPSSVERRNNVKSKKNKPSNQNPG